jgi:polyketide biosynthesis enoyl-CoA hydratase PksI
MSAVAPPVRWSVTADGVATIQMADADGRNALSEAFVHALTTAMAAAAADPAARVMILSGTAEVFCSGAPQSLLLDLLAGTMTPSDILLPKAMLSAPLPLIAAMAGHAVGGGFALGLCADIVIVARESRYGCNFMDLGLTPGMGTTRLLEQVLSPALARELIFSGELRRGSEFEGQGFNYVLPRAEVGPKAHDLAARIAEKPRHALETLKRGLAARRLRVFEESLALESAMHRAVLSDPETRRRIETDYVE